MSPARHQFAVAWPRVGPRFLDLCVGAIVGGLLAIFVVKEPLVDTHVWDTRRSENGREANASRIAVVVPGGGLTPEGTPPPWVKRRLREAAEIHKTMTGSGHSVTIITLSRGTPHKPMSVDSSSHFEVCEAEGNAKCLLKEFGIPPDDVAEECWSLDTVGNAFMLRLMHTEIGGWRRLIIVNNQFHMPRTRAIFEKVFQGLGPPLASGSYDLEFIEVPNDGLDQAVLSARLERESSSLLGFQNRTAGIRSLTEMHNFIFREHLAYASKRLFKDRAPVDLNALGSY